MIACIVHLVFSVVKLQVTVSVAGADCVLAHSPTMSTSTPTPYTIAIPESDLDILADKLAHATLPDELSAEREGAEWDRGSPLADISRLSKYWRDQYTSTIGASTKLSLMNCQITRLRFMLTASEL